jgi:hypothetical protein
MRGNMGGYFLRLTFNYGEFAIIKIRIVEIAIYCSEYFATVKSYDSSLGLVWLADFDQTALVGGGDIIP